MKSYKFMIFFIIVMIFGCVMLLCKGYIQLPVYGYQNVEIQILGNHNHDEESVIDKDYKFLVQEIHTDQESVGVKGDLDGAENISFFDKTYLTGILNQNDMNFMSIAEHDERNQTM